MRRRNRNSGSLRASRLLACVGTLGLLLIAGPPSQALSPAHVRDLNFSMALTGAATRSPNGAITLTSNGQSSVGGAAWYPKRLRVLSPFSTTFTFRISPAAPIGAFMADGFAFVIQSDPRGTGALGQYGDEIGFGADPCGAPSDHVGISHSIAVEFDTSPTPASFFCRSKSIGDPSANHISILTRYRMPNSADEQYSLGSTSDIPNMRDGRQHQIALSYIPGRMSVTFDGKSVLSVVVDLARLGLGSGGRAYIGFTAATGDFSETHQILRFGFRHGR